MSARDHGGDLDRARAAYGDGDWIDLSTGINRIAYPVGEIPPGAFAHLPTRAEIEDLLAAARAAFATPAPIAAFAGAQTAIQLLASLGPPGLARILGPTYNEYAAQFACAGWRVEITGKFEALAGADLAVIVNPNNPDGLRFAPEALLALREKVGRLLVDESFADALPELSLCPHADRENLVVLRSFGKFYGLAGLRLGFALGCAKIVAALRDAAGPWPVSGPAIAVGTAALHDEAWRATTCRRLAEDAGRLDALAARAGWPLVGGTGLFRLYETGDSLAAQKKLARMKIWTRAFPWSGGWLRLGLPGAQEEWRRLEAALSS
ncbi:threonine-phosphate decarboxylase CobD [Rhodoblastus sp.]|uniref:threonine-phosphate decarboxylase CobD n=1 Tax=Rhodoblastus sp. TaxID=1962975 RepID=UPI003F9579D4